MMTKEFKKLGEELKKLTEEDAIGMQEIIKAHAKIISMMFESHKAGKEESIEMIVPCNGEYALRVVCKRVYSQQQKTH